jgi:hypothetical protein
MSEMIDRVAEAIFDISPPYICGWRDMDTLGRQYYQKLALVALKEICDILLVKHETMLGDVEDLMDNIDSKDMVDRIAKAIFYAGFPLPRDWEDSDADPYRSLYQDRAIAVIKKLRDPERLAGWLPAPISG